MISTKGRYSIRILLDLAEHRNGSYIPMKDVAARQNISLKYIERLMPALKAAGLVDSVHGIGGGYRLTREPDQYTLWEILRLAEGDLAPVACLQSGAAPCARAADCRTLSVWDGYYKVDKTHKRAVMGTGLGLSIVKNILELHHAGYGVVSEPGCGSTFWFELKIER